MQKKHLFRTMLLIFVAAMFLVDIYGMIANFTERIGNSYHQKSINVAFRSAFGVFEIILAGTMVFFIRKYPQRRIRLISLLFFHVVGVMIVPMVTRNVSWMALTFPWPQTLLAFDKSTPAIILVLSLITGFLIIPLITFLWGRKAFCGYVCPLGGYYSECFGRLFHPKPGKMQLLRRFGPPVNFTLMVLLLATLLIVPSTLAPIRMVHKQLFFIISQVLYFTIGISFVGARSYCTHLCPLGYEIGAIARWKNQLKRRTPSSSLRNR